MADSKATVERPLSPHLFIYKPMLTMMMSIVHRHDPYVGRRLLRHGGAALMGAGKRSTPLGRVRGLGSAKSGTAHFWRQRLTAVANIPLTIAFVVIVVALLGRNHAAVVQIL